MVAVLIAFPLLMLGTLVYVGLSAHEETPVGTSGAGQTGCVACAEKHLDSAAKVANRSEVISESTVEEESELIAA
jgi:hypothetical protein